jgi:hypothetical protein
MFSPKELEEVYIEYGLYDFRLWDLLQQQDSGEKSLDQAKVLVRRHLESLLPEGDTYKTQV